MKYRRCHALAVVPVEQPRFSFAELLQGGSGLSVDLQIQVLAGHLDTPRVIDAEHCGFLLGCSPEIWRPVPVQPDQKAMVMGLAEQGLLLLDADAESAIAAADQRVRSVPWWPLSAIHHRHSRWDGVDSALEMERNRLVTSDDLVGKLGKPPAEAALRHPDAVSLERTANPAALEIMWQRATCRNYDKARMLPLGMLAAMLEQVLMAQAVVETEPGVRFLKKNVPSAGSLHPTEAYVLARRVDGLQPALYHYHAVGHELVPVANQPADLDGFALDLLAGQHWFSAAHVLVVLVCRFGRSFWKYRRHAKAYRAVTLDAGHLSQALYMAATSHGLGAFVTSAINEPEIERLLALDPIEEGVMAVSGFGWRASAMVTPEFDPLGKIWPTATPA